MAKVDLTGQRFGKLTVISKVPQKYNDGFTRWLCKCDCGKEVIARTNNLRSGHTKSCGCTRKKEKIISDVRRPNDLTGQRFGKLIAVESTEKRSSSGAVLWKCRCDCGNDILVKSTDLKNGTVKSCGCATSQLLSESSTITNITRGETRANTSGRVGVVWIEKRGKYRAQIGITENGKKRSIHLGYFDNYGEAVNARVLAEKKYYGLDLKKVDFYANQE